MPQVIVVDTAVAARALAGHLLDPARRRPVVLVTSQAGRPQPLVDVAAVVAETAGLADTYQMATGEITWAFAHALSDYPGTECYGGACRVYPPGSDWTTDLRRSPLRFVFSAADAERVGRLIISDAAEMAFRARAVQPTPVQRTSRADGRVSGVVSGRGLVNLDNGAFAAIWPELTVPGVAVERLLQVGQPVSGTLDETAGRLDVTGLVREPADALAGYTAGAQVLGRVEAVEPQLCVVELFPGYCCAVESADVVDTPLTIDLRQWLTVGEVVTVRVLAVGDAEDTWRLSMTAVEPGQPTADAPTILPGGPPWLVPQPEPPTTPEATEAVTFPALAPVPTGPRDLLTTPPAPATPAVPAPAAATVVDRRPSPADLARRTGRQAVARPGSPLTIRPQPAPAPAAASAPAASTPAAAAPAEDSRLARLSGEVDQLRATLSATAAERAALEARLTATAAERDAVAAERDAVAAQLSRTEQQLTARKGEAATLRTQRRDAQTALSRAQRRLGGGTETMLEDHAADERAFVDPEDQLRYEVHLAWARRIPAAEKAHLPLGAYTLGPEFLATLDATDGVDRAKVVDVIVDIATGRIHQVPGRQTHQLRSGETGNAPYVTRPDGATCWRVSLQHKSPQARRLHFWQLSDGSSELSSVRLHDDMRP